MNKPKYKIGNKVEIRIDENYPSSMIQKIKSLPIPYIATISDVGVETNIVEYIYSMKEIIGYYWKETEIKPFEVITKDNNRFEILDL
jgi:hypothetical protein